MENAPEFKIISPISFAVTYGKSHADSASPVATSVILSRFSDSRRLSDCQYEFPAVLELLRFV
jgi:hypothetical protein